MLLYDDARDLQDQCLYQRSRGRIVGLVPTMGNLHEGHLSLVKQAASETDFVVVSIFVNPLQFNDPDDLKKYPRTFEQDLEKLKGLPVDVVFHPTAETMYGDHMSTQVRETALSSVACGKSRPGHFEGVCTVVLKLLNICMPHRAFFGQKDYQQMSIIKRMVDNLSFPTLIREVPTVREESGLAMSSRNSLLNPEDRKTAAGIFRALSKMKDVANARPGILWSDLYQHGVGFLKEEMGDRFDLEYLEAFEAGSFTPIPDNFPCHCHPERSEGSRPCKSVILRERSERRISSCHDEILRLRLRMTIGTAQDDSGRENCVICIAGKISDIRLIDNIQL